MAIVSTLSLLFALYLVLDAVFRKVDFFSPARLYFFFHSLTLGIAFLAADKAMTPFKPLTNLVYFGSAACFLLGSWIVKVLAEEGDVRTGKLTGLGEYNWKLHMRLTFLLFLIFVVGIAIASLGIGGVPLLAKDKAKAIIAFFKVNWYSSVALSYGGLTIAMFFMAIFRPRTLPRILNSAFWMMVLSLIIFALALSRSGLIFFAFFAIVFYNYAVKRLSIPKLGVIFVLLFSIFMVTGYLKLSNFQKEHQLNVHPLKLARLMLKFPYVYVANNFWNLDYALNPDNAHERHPTTYGFTTFSGVLDMMALPGGTLGVGIRAAGGWDDQFHARSIKVRGLNTMGYQWGLYKDFGMAGVFIFPFLFGMAAKMVHLRVKYRPNVFYVALYSFLAFFIGLSWFLAFWESMIYVYGLLYLVGTCYLSQRTYSGGDAQAQAA
ncbi:MAG: O-antigen polymerase [Fibrobacteria bacterium]